MSKLRRVMLITCSILGCGSPAYDSGDLESYRSAIRAGRATIKLALEMETKFPRTEHMIIMYGAVGSDEHEWQTVSFFGGRYQLTMAQSVILSSDGTRIRKVIGEPVFYLLKCESVTADGGASYTGKLSLDRDKWNAFRESNFDMKIIDPDWDGSVLEDFDAFADSVQASRKIWR